MNNSKVLSEKRERVILICIIAWGFLLRIIGYNWGGEGMIFNTDEFSIVEPVIHMVKSHTLLHQVWVYPSMCSSKILAVFLMPISFLKEIPRFDYYYAVRIMYALFSTLIIFISYKLVREIEGSTIALLFSFLLTVNPTMVKYAKMAVGDTPVLMFWLLVALFMKRYITNRRVSELLFMSFFAACAMLEKWNGAGVTIFIAIGVICYNIRDIKKLIIHGLIAFGVWIASMLIMAPNIITSIPDITAAVIEANQALGSSTFYGQFKYFLDYSGIGALILMLAGLTAVLSEKIFGGEQAEANNTRFPYLIVVISLIEDWALCESQAERHGMIVQWGCMLFICIGFYYLYTRTKMWRMVGVITFSLVICALTMSVILANVVAIRSRQHDTRVVGVKFLEELGADTHNTIGESYTPYYPPIGDNVMEGAYDYGNMINELIYYDEDGTPCVALPDKKFAVIGDYKWADKSRGGYAVLNTEDIPQHKFDSDYAIDLKADFKGLGQWYGSELDTIRENFRVIKEVCASDRIGPSFVVYDISSFTYKERD